MLRKSSRLYWTLTCHNKLSFETCFCLKNQVYLRVLVLSVEKLLEAIFIGLIANLRFLDSLTIRRSTIDSRHFREYRVDVPSLRNLVLDNCSWKFLNYLGATSVQKLELSGIYHALPQYYEPFLQSLTSLEDLTLGTWRSMVYEFLSQENNIPFRLKRLEISRITWTDIEIGHLLGTVHVHAATLGHLGLKLRAGFNDLLEHVLTRMNITSLMISPAILPLNRFFYDRIPINRQITCLELYYDRIGIPVANRLFMILPNIRELRFEKSMVSDVLLHAVSQQIPNLETLYTRESFRKNRVATELRIESVTSLHIEELFKFPFGLRPFFESSIIHLHMPNIEMLTIYTNGLALTEQLLEELTTRCPKLHTLNLLQNQFSDEYFSSREKSAHIRLRSNHKFKEFLGFDKSFLTSTDDVGNGLEIVFM
jgi:hypothetical protein